MKDHNIVEREAWEVLNEELVIPEIVKQKANDTFCRIQKETRIYQKEGKGGAEILNTRTHRKNKRKLGAAFLVSALVICAVTAGASVYLKWSSGMEKELHITEEQKEMAESTGLADFPEIAVTHNGVTVTAQQSIVDNYYAYLSFRVEGYDSPEGEQPMFSDTVITVGGEDVAWVASFYDGLISDESGMPVLADGSPVPQDENGNFLIDYTDYTTEDGSLEYRVNISGGGESGYFMEKPVHIELKNLGCYTDKDEAERVDVEGTWTFDWTLRGDDSIRAAECNEVLGDTGATVTKVEVSPISIKAVLEMPRQKLKEEFGFISYVEPPLLTGVKLVDGTILPRIYMGSGTMGYVDEVSDTYEARFAIDRILDVDQVESLLFIKSYPEDGRREFTEDNFYMVDIG